MAPFRDRYRGRVSLGHVASLGSLTPDTLDACRHGGLTELEEAELTDGQGVLHQDPFTGHLFVFRGRTRANPIKIIYWDGTGFCLFTKRLEHGVFLWPPSVKPDETLSLTSAQLSSLIEGVDWRAPEQRWRPAIAG